MNEFAKNKTRSPAVVFLSGEGGHMAQAIRIREHITESNLSASHQLMITDHPSEEIKGFESLYSIPTCAPKDRRATLMEYIHYSVSVFKTCMQVTRKHRVVTVIVTGPGFAVYPALWFKLFRAELIVLESWSRFENRSKCSKVLYPFADHFWVQHEQLLKLYPRGKWVGLL